MNQGIFNYAKVLSELPVSTTSVLSARDLLKNSQLMNALNSPIIRKKEKHKVIESLFPKEICNFMKMMCDAGQVEYAEPMFEEYNRLILKEQNVIQGVLRYTTIPTEEQISGIKKMICDRFGKDDVELLLEEDFSLIGGFVLTVDDLVWDRSLKASINRMQKSLVER